MSESERLLSIATAIADGAEVRWADEAGRAATAGDTATLNALRDLEQLLTAVRRADREDEPTPPTASPDEEVSIGTPRRWRHLMILGTIGQGSFGTVYRAHDPGLGVDVALKLLSSSRAAGRGQADRILKEAQRLARVRHPNVVRVYGVDEAGENVGLWMEFVQGHTLRELLKTQGPFSAYEASIIGRDLCRAIAAVHQAGIVHGDIKAHNVMREAGGRIVLMDFGAGQDLADEPGTVLAGTPVYLAPEVLDGRPRSASSDIYALGVLLYHLVTRSYPVTGPSLDELIAAHQRGDRRHLRDARPDLPDEFVRTVEQAVSAEPRQRFGSLGQFEDALVRVTSPARAVPDSTAPRLDPRRSALGRWALPVAAVVALAVAGVGAGWLMSRNSRPAALVANETARPAADTSLGGGPAVSNLYNIEAAFFRAARGGEERLQPDGRVAPGDELFLKLQASVPLHVYVVDEDEKGAAFLLFPLRGERLTNPLPAGQPVIVPGATRWQVTSQGEREHFLIFASPEPLDSLEEAFARLPVPRAGMPVGGAPLATATLERLRGVGGLTAAPAAQDGQSGLSRLFTLPLTDAPERARGLWVRQLTLDNPVR